LNPERGADLLASEVRVVNVGLTTFADALRSVGVPVQHVEWRPAAGGAPATAWLLAELDLHADRIGAANDQALACLLDAQPVWIDVGPAGEVIPGLTSDTILHAGPPVSWAQMSGTQRGAIMAALIFEGFAKNGDEAMQVGGSGRIHFAPCHEYAAVGPMGGAISASMPVIVVENRAAGAGNRAYSTFNAEGSGASHTMGLFGPPVQAMLGWVRDVLAPAMRRAVFAAGGIDLKALIGRALQMGDEAHNRHLASTSLLTRMLLPHLAEAAPPADLRTIGEFLARNDWFFLNFSMAACKATADAASGIPWSTLVTAIARNGVETGIRLSGLPNRWFTAPAPMVDGLYFPGFTAADASPDIGDSAITETCGLGAFALAAAPAMTSLVGGSAAGAAAYTCQMREITLREHPVFVIPHLDFRGTPVGIDVRAVVETAIAPVVDTAIAHREPGRGMIGAGLVRVPLECFVHGLEAFAATYTRQAPL
jgi:Protein of unknown function (DUF1116)